MTASLLGKSRTVQSKARINTRISSCGFSWILCDKTTLQTFSKAKPKDSLAWPPPVGHDVSPCSESWRSQAGALSPSSDAPSRGSDWRLAAAWKDCTSSEFPRKLQGKASKNDGGGKCLKLRRQRLDSNLSPSDWKLVTLTVVLQFQTRQKALLVNLTQIENRINTLHYSL